MALAHIAASAAEIMETRSRIHGALRLFLSQPFRGAARLELDRAVETYRLGVKAERYPTRALSGAALQAHLAVALRGALEDLLEVPEGPLAVERQQHFNKLLDGYLDKALAGLVDLPRFNFPDRTPQPYRAGLQGRT